LKGTDESEHRPRVTIVTVVLNAVDSIERAVESVLEQDYEDLEYIVIDGGSEDGTWERLQRYAHRIDRLIRESDDGIYDAMNKGIAKASGELIGILNADDRYFPDSVDKAVKAQQEENAGIVHGAMEIRFPDRKETPIQHGEVSQLPYKASVNHPSCFVHREVYERIGTFDTRYRISADHEFLLRAYRNGVRFAYVDEPLVSYLYGGASLTCKSDLETYRILKEHGTGHHRKCLTRYLKCIAKRGIKRLMGRRS
jgi:glycosyltransferase involved in cell wall biosynthesis